VIQNELLRGEVCKLLIKPERYQRVSADNLQDPSFLDWPNNGIRLGSWLQKSIRVAIKSQNCGGKSRLFRKVYEFVKQLLMAQVDAIEFPNGNGSFCKVFWNDGVT
jgi:hypothetical protein